MAAPNQTDQAPTWLRGVLGLCLLALVSEGETYGYELGRRLESAGMGMVPGGSLYPALLRLERLELLRAEWRPGDGGPGRRYYTITAAGRETLARDAAAWSRFSANIEAIVGAAAR